jgi:histidine triad (HIT) family protein
MSEDCLFCKIIGGEIPCSRVYEDDSVLAFDDIHPMAPVHVIVIPKRHISTLMDVSSDSMTDLMKLMAAAQKVAKLKSIDEKGSESSSTATRRADRSFSISICTYWGAQTEG